MRNEAAGELRKPGGDVVAEGHHAKAFNGIDENDVVGDVRTRLRRGGADDQRSGIDRALTAGALLNRVRRAANPTEAATEILQAPARCAGLIDDRFRTRGPVRQRLFAISHRVSSRNMLTCDDSTPPSPCSSAIEESRTCRGPARSVICRCVSTRCAIAPPTPQ